MAKHAKQKAAENKDVAADDDDDSDDDDQIGS